MKLIALRNFLNVPSLDIQLDKSQNPVNPQVIHKGAQFEIGKSEKFTDLPARDRENVSLLNYANCIGDANNPKIVEAVNKELLAEATATKAAAAATATASKRV